MLTIALVTWSGLPELSPGDRMLQTALAARGHAVRAAVWDDPSVDWTAFDTVILRSTWDYHKRIAEFATWLDARQADGAPMWNPPALVRQNIHKGYLLDLGARGVPIVPTELIPCLIDPERVTDGSRGSAAFCRPPESRMPPHHDRGAVADAIQHRGECSATLAGSDVEGAPSVRGSAKGADPRLPSPTPSGSTPTLLSEIRTCRGWASVVVKPAVGATAFRTAVDPDEEAFAALIAEGDVLVQPFLGEVVSDGEWSLIFFGGAFSHAVLKRPRTGDFRVQNDFGGSAVLTVPSPQLVAEAARVLEAVDGRWLYARVDGVVVNGTFLLMELELTEPSLFLELDDAAVTRFAEVISGWA